jgi:membrane protein implicated in regulation of membrane protease activity
MALLIFLVTALVVLFGAIIFLFALGAERLGWPWPAHVTIFVVVSGVFAWLLKRLTDSVSGMSRRWFPEENAVPQESANCDET